MEAAVFDTNILIEFSRQHAGAQDIIRRVPHRLISIMTWVEFLTGIPDPQMETAKAFLLDMFTVLDTQNDTYARALDLRRARGLKLPDALIYANAKEQSAPLITRNHKDFKDTWDDIIIPY